MARLSEHFCLKSRPNTCHFILFADWWALTPAAAGESPSQAHARCGTKEVPRQASRRESGNEGVDGPPYWLITYIVVLIGGTIASPFLRALVMVAIQAALLLGSSLGALARMGRRFPTSTRRQYRMVE